MMSTSKMEEGGDRLSALPDKALVRILSGLMTAEAVRTSVLCRRWRYVHEDVPVVDLVDNKKPERSWSRIDELQVCFDHQVACAILGKAPETPIPVFRLSNVLSVPYDLLGQWIATAVASGVEDLDVKLRYGACAPRPLCPINGSTTEDESWMYTRTPHQIFGCRTLRRLRLTCWTLDLPGSVGMAALETIHLSRVGSADGPLQQLLSSCPRLADLTLEECASIKEIAVTSPCLRSFAMICCHNATAVELHTTCLRSLHYKGGLPPPGSAFIVVANYLAVTTVRIEICGGVSLSSEKLPEEVAPVMTLISQCERLTHLDLCLGRYVDYAGLLTGVPHVLPDLSQLSLDGGRLVTKDALLSVAASRLCPEPPSNFSDDESDTKPKENFSDDEPDTNPKEKGWRQQRRQRRRRQRRRQLQALV